jgi:cysteine desulfurase
VRPDAIYWDWNATTPPHPEVLEEMRRASEEAWANPSSQHQLGRAARRRIEEVRERVAGLFQVHPRDVLFAGSGTEANNLALRGASAVVVSRLDHPSIISVAEELESQGRQVRWVPVPESGRLDAAEVERQLETLPEALQGSTVVALTAANHETGVLQDVAGIARVVQARGARLHVDAAQALGKLPLESYGAADSYTLVAHKIRGPQAIAALAWRGTPPLPVLLGGSQERGLRPGTLSAQLVAGFGAALARLDPGRYAGLLSLRDQLEAQLAPYALINGGTAPRLPHVSNLSFTGWSGERLVAALDVRGVCVSTGSACRVGTAEPSAAVAAMLGLARAQTAIRISLGEDADDQQLQRGIAVLIQLLTSKVSSSSGAT